MNAPSLRRLLPLGLLAAALPAAAGCRRDPPPSASLDPRNPEWARRVALRGVPNLYEVTPDLYRGAQPTPEGFRQLAGLGIRTIVDLRYFHSDIDELRAADEASAFNYVRIRSTAWWPETEDVVGFLRVATDPEMVPVFVHCEYGSDRTGMMVAAYRVVVQGWSKRRAIAEMTRGGYGYHWFWVDLVDFIQDMDVPAIRREVGVSGPVRPARPVAL